jgi:predicted DNA-binding protein
MRRHWMAESVLVNRKKFVSSLSNELVEPFAQLSKKTRIPKSRLLDEAIEDLLAKYEKKDG